MNKTLNVILKGELAGIYENRKILLDYDIELTTRKLLIYLSTRFQDINNYINHYGLDEMIVLVDNRILRHDEVVEYGKTVIIITLPSGG